MYIYIDIHSLSLYTHARVLVEYDDIENLTSGLRRTRVNSDVGCL